MRVRCYENLARIEVDKEFGFKYVTLDLEGYKVGSFNEEILNTATSI